MWSCRKTLQYIVREVINHIVRVRFIRNKNYIFNILEPGKKELLVFTSYNYFLFINHHSFSGSGFLLLFFLSFKFFCTVLHNVLNTRDLCILNVVRILHIFKENLTSECQGHTKCGCMLMSCRIPGLQPWKIATTCPQECDENQIGYTYTMEKNSKLFSNKHYF